MSSAPARNVTESALVAGLRAGGWAVIYQVSGFADSLAALEVALDQELDPVDARGVISEEELRAQLQGRSTSEPLVILFGSRVDPSVRVVLTEWMDRSGSPRAIALTTASSVSPEVGALFPLQIAAGLLRGAR